MTPYLYELKHSLLSNCEMEYMKEILNILPENYRLVPQANLASFIDRTDSAKYRNELYRNVDFLIVDSAYRPKAVIEINDSTHNDPTRRERDKKVKNICEEAGITVIPFWTSYGINTEYIQKKVVSVLNSPPPQRIRHSATAAQDTSANTQDAIQPPENVVSAIDSASQQQHSLSGKKGGKQIKNSLLITAVVLAALSLFMTVFPLFESFVYHSTQTLSQIHSILPVLVGFNIAALVIGIIALKNPQTKSKGKLAISLSVIGAVLCIICFMIKGGISL